MPVRASISIGSSGRHKPRLHARALAVSLALLCSAQAQTVVVTGAYEPVPLEEMDRSVRVVPARELSILTNLYDDLLHLDSSLDLQQRAPGAIQSGLSIRGGTFGQTLVLLNGFRINDVQSANHNLDVPLPPDAIERIEILRGSGSTLYGSDAVAGVVNLRIRPPEVSEFRLRAGAGNFGVNQQRGSWTVASTRWSQQFSFSRDFSSGFRENRDFRNLALAGVSRLATRLGEGEWILAHNDRPFGADRFYGNFNSWERTRTWFAGVRQALGGRTDVSFAFRRHTDLFVLYRDRPEVFTNRHAVESYQGALRRKETLGANARLHYGVEAHRDSIASTNLGRHSRARTAGYAALDVRALRRFSFTLGAREEAYRNIRREFSPTASAGLWISERFKLRGSASRAFRLPTFTDLYYHDPANLGSPDLRPETAWSFEGGLDWNAGPRLRGQAAVFQRRERDGIDYVRATPADLWRATNFRRLRFSGAEIALEAGLARGQRVELRYTALRGVGRAGGLMSKYTFNYPLHTGLATWQGSLKGGLLVRTRLGVVQRFARDPYAVWDFNFASSRGRLRPFVQFSNLAGARYEEIPGVPMPGRGVLGGVQILLLGPLR
ncbi:MAG: TonB-dependent receptor [Acidobacteria bacterium]|nr:TonB-dependent receptor [Acidobacteriota bacterium]